MRYVSLFSGIEAASVAWEPLGWEPMAFSEIDLFCCAVLAERFPQVPNLGDVEKVDWGGFVGSCGRPDVVVGGSPCQAFSVAGRRAGLEDARGRLMFEFVRAVRELGPRWVLWENVPGVLSQDEGRAFGTLVGELEECGYRLAWRVLDAQFFGVAQRRRRVFLVGSPDLRCAAALLLEPGCLSRDSPSSREKRKALAEGAGFGASGASWGLTTANTNANGSNVRSEVAPTLDRTNSQAVAYAEACGPRGGVFGNDTASTLKANAPTTENVVCMTQYGDVAGTLTAKFDSSPCPDRGQNVVCMIGTQEHGAIDDDVCGTLTARQFKDAPVVAFVQNTRDEVRLQGGDGSLSGALAAQPGMKQQTYVAAKGRVRRLMPVECERLQGFPDDWTRIPWRGKPAEECPDGPRYKAIGNSMAVPVMRWIGERLRMADAAMRKE